MSDRPLLDRAQLARIAQNVPQTIAGLEKLVGNVAGMPSTIEEANALAGSALVVAQGAMAMIALLADALAQVEGAPAAVPHVDPDDTAPRAHLGTISSQNADAVEITGGTAGLDAGAPDKPSLSFGQDPRSGFYRSAGSRVALSIAQVMLLELSSGLLALTGRAQIDTGALGTALQPALYFGGDATTGLYRSAADVLAIATAGSQRVYFDTTGMGVWGDISASGQIVSNVATGTPPLVVNSVTMVPNLYAARADSANYAAMAGQLDAPSTYPGNATDLPSAIALANALRAAAISKGL